MGHSSSDSHAKAVIYRSWTQSKGNKTQNEGLDVSSVLPSVASWAQARSYSFLANTASKWQLYSQAGTQEFCPGQPHPLSAFPFSHLHSYFVLIQLSSNSLKKKLYFVFAINLYQTLSECIEEKGDIWQSVEGSKWYPHRTQMSQI